ncbi:MAG: alpha/beta hydrolase [Myxococcota bacterium]
MESNAARVERRRLRGGGDLRELGGLRGGSDPRDLEIAGGGPRVLALHGFGGTPYEVELVLDSARDLGLGGLAPLLPGHGTHAKRLAATRFPDWADAAESALDRVGGPVILAGFSLGSLLALHLTQKRPQDIRALILLGNAAWLTAPFPRWALMLAERLRLPDFLMPKKGPRMGDDASSLAHMSYDAHPVHAAIEVRRTGERIREQLAHVRCPTLILHGARDRTCPVSNAWRVAERLGCDDCRVVIFPRSRHVLTRDIERDDVRREIATFLGRFAATSQ